VVGRSGEATFSRVRPSGCPQSSGKYVALVLGNQHGGGSATQPLATNVSGETARKPCSRTASSDQRSKKWYSRAKHALQYWKIVSAQVRHLSK